MVIASAVIISVLPMSLRTGLKISSPASRMTQRLHWRDFILPEVTRQVGRLSDRRIYYVTECEGSWKT